MGWVGRRGTTLSSANPPQQFKRTHRYTRGVHSRPRVSRVHVARERSGEAARPAAAAAAPAKLTGSVGVRAGVVVVVVVVAVAVAVAVVAPQAPWGSSVGLCRQRWVAAGSRRGHGRVASGCRARRGGVGVRCRGWVGAAAAADGGDGRVVGRVVRAGT